MSTVRTAVFFHYFEVNSTYLDNLIFFLTVAYRDDLDFFIILASSCSVGLPQQNNIRYIAVENKNNDFGGYCDALAATDISAYDNFIFVNSSVRGPFFNRSKYSNWERPLLEMLKGDVHLVGSSINILSRDSKFTREYLRRFSAPLPLSHVQTTAYALSATALKHLLSVELYKDRNTLDKESVIVEYEIRLAQEVKANGWNIKCLLPEYNNIDYRTPHADINPFSRNGDVLYTGAYFGRTPHPTELMFIKTNRNLLSERELLSHTMTALAATGANRVKAQWSAAEDLAARMKEGLAPLHMLGQRQKARSRPSRLMERLFGQTGRS